MAMDPEGDVAGDSPETRGGLGTRGAIGRRTGSALYHMLQMLRKYLLS